MRGNSHGDFKVRLTITCAVAVIALFPIMQSVSALANESTTTASGSKYYYHDGHRYNYRHRGGFYDWHTRRGYYKVRYACGAGWCYR
jgi:hypothetical protein